MARPHVAIVYDFDGTLAPGNLQEEKFLPDIGVAPDAFWQEVRRESKKKKADSVLTYMKMMLEGAEKAKVPVGLSSFEEYGKSIVFFAGVRQWFERIKKYGRSRGVTVDHYVISAGNEEIIRGTSIARYFEEIYGCRFMFDHNDVPTWPALAINFTTKTQYLFRINKGAHDLSDTERINSFMEDDDRPVPFKNMIYIGDGPTDIPCLRLVKSLGGFSIAVFDPNNERARPYAAQILADRRADCVVRADYRSREPLDRVVKARIDVIASRSRLAGLIASRTTDEVGDDATERGP